MAKRNQKYGKKRQAGNLTWMLIVIGGGLLLLTAVLFARSRDNPGTASIAVDQQKIDDGYVKFGETRQFTVKVTNTGDGTLRFKERPYIEVLEGC